MARMYEKHFRPMVFNLTLRERFHVANRPTPLPQPPLLPAGKEFFGLHAADMGCDILVEYDLYVKEWDLCPAELWEKKDNFKFFFFLFFFFFCRGHIFKYSLIHFFFYTRRFWESKKMEYPELSRVALWWAVYPVSSIASERTFSVGRCISESHLRASMEWPTFVTEFILRNNLSYVEKALRIRLDLIKKT